MKLKSETILQRKPNLKVKPNHMVIKSNAQKRIWLSGSQGTAVKDGKGWYHYAKN